MREQGRRVVGGELPGALIWLVGVVGRIEWERGRTPADPPYWEEEPPPGLTYALVVDTAAELFAGLQRDPGGPPVLWAVNRNRPARPAIWRSRVTVKADAATRLFSLSCRTLCWAVLDSGVDATHPAFARRTGDEPLAATPDGTRPAAPPTPPASPPPQGRRAAGGDPGRDAPGGRVPDQGHLRLHAAARAARRRALGQARDGVRQRDQRAAAQRPRCRLEPAPAAPGGGRGRLRRPHPRARHPRRRRARGGLADGGSAGAGRPHGAGRVPGHGALRPAGVRRDGRG